MPIDLEFPRNHHVIGKHFPSDGKNFHLVWCPGRSDAESYTDQQVQKAVKERGEEYLPIGIHVTYVAVYCDCCIANDSCIASCRVQVFQWYRTENDLPAIEMANIVKRRIWK